MKNSWKRFQTARLSCLSCKSPDPWAHFTELCNLNWVISHNPTPLSGKPGLQILPQTVSVRITVVMITIRCLQTAIGTLSVPVNARVRCQALPAHQEVRTYKVARSKPDLCPAHQSRSRTWLRWTRVWIGTHRKFQCCVFRKEIRDLHAQVKLIFLTQVGRGNQIIEPRVRECG